MSPLNQLTVPLIAKDKPEDQIRDKLKNSDQSKEQDEPNDQNNFKDNDCVKDLDQSIDIPKNQFKKDNLNDSTMQSIHMKPLEPNLINLPFEDILINKILPLLSIDDLFSLKSVSSFFDRIISFYFRKLKKLNLSKSKWLTYQQISLILSLNHNLITQLDLSYNLSLNNRRLNSYLVVYRFNQLNSIKLNDVHWLDPRVFSALILILGRQLECIELSGCWLLNDDCINLLSSYCFNLKELNVSRIYCLTDRSLLNLGYRCNQLRSLNLSKCWYLTDIAIYYLISQCSQLTDLLL